MKSYIYLGPDAYTEEALCRTRCLLCRYLDHLGKSKRSTLLLSLEDSGCIEDTGANHVHLFQGQYGFEPLTLSPNPQHTGFRVTQFVLDIGLIQMFFLVLSLFVCALLAASFNHEVLLSRPAPHFEA